MKEKRVSFPECVASFSINTKDLVWDSVVCALQQGG